MTLTALLARYPQWDYLVKAGAYYGYPACCIEAFVLQNERGMGWIDREEEVKQAIEPYSHGFVPCVACARKILAGEATFESLISGRECKTPFPVDKYTGKIVSSVSWTPVEALKKSTDLSKRSSHARAKRPIISPPRRLKR